jgi:pyruvate dehydrogenase E2 component (dihydrolipoyllysine-residue acetyltransferase)
MATAVQVPQFGTTVEECIVTRWFTRKGSTVAAGEVIAEIETDKTTFEINAPVDGTVLETFFDEGAVVPVFTNLCVIGSDGESVEGFRPASGAPHASASARAGAHASDGPSTGSGPSRAASRDGETSPKPPDTDIREGGPAAAAAPRSWRPRARRPAADTPSSTRTLIARRMRDSLASTAQYTLHASANATGLTAMRIRAKASPRLAHVTIGDLVAYCTIHALREVPALNAEYKHDEVITHGDVHLGFACDTPRGLLVPVIRHADRLTLAELAHRAKTLAMDAVKGKISPDDLSGATFTISNLGGLGVETFTPVINPPQVAILGVGAIQLKPVRTAGGVEFIDSIGLSLTLDHQAIDGAPGARFLASVKQKIESVELIVSDAFRS